MHSSIEFTIFFISFFILAPLIISYLIGSLSSAIIVCHIMNLPDPRTQGSNNPGATNVMRIGGKKAAYLTFAGDFLKGLIPVLTTTVLFSHTQQIPVFFAGLGAFLGHLYPVYFGFKGGKGVATFVGVICGIHIILLPIFGVFWLAILFSTRYVSLASMIGAVAVAISGVLLHYSSPIIILLFFLAILIIFRHRTNIKNLLKGEEKHFRKK